MLWSSSLPIHVGQAVTAERLVRGWRPVDRNELRRVLEDSPLARPVAVGVIVDELFSTYNSVLRDVVDSLAPRHRLHLRPGRSAPWFDADCRAARRNCRRLERRHRRSYAVDDRRRCVDAVT